MMESKFISSVEGEQYLKDFRRQGLTQPDEALLQAFDDGATAYHASESNSGGPLPELRVAWSAGWENEVANDY